MPKYACPCYGDFNIHICCPNEPISRYFLNVIASFNLLQFVSGPTYERWHTLDLVLSHGLPVSDMDICDAVFSDYLPLQLCSLLLLLVFARVVRHPLCLNAEELALSFRSNCLKTLDLITPLKSWRTSALVESRAQVEEGQAPCLSVF